MSRAQHSVHVCERLHVPLDVPCRWCCSLARAWACIAPWWWCGPAAPGHHCASNRSVSTFTQPACTFVLSTLLPARRCCSS